VDKDVKSAQEINASLRHRTVKRIESKCKERESKDAGSIIATYECDLLNRNAIREIAEKLEDKINGIDVLITCNDQSNEDIFDTISTTLMSHYWVNISLQTFEYILNDLEIYVIVKA
jgi:short-subunit dehydrogenase